jgi:hypothetical protein
MEFDELTETRTLERPCVNGLRGDLQERPNLLHCLVVEQLRSQVIGSM